MKRGVCNPVTHALQAASPSSLCCQPHLPIPDHGHRARKEPLWGHELWCVVSSSRMKMDVPGHVFLSPQGVKGRRESLASFFTMEKSQYEESKVEAGGLRPRH